MGAYPCAHADRFSALSTAFQNCGAYVEVADVVGWRDQPIDARRCKPTADIALEAAGDTIAPAELAVLRHRDPRAQQVEVVRRIDMRVPRGRNRREHGPG